MGRPPDPSRAVRARASPIFYGAMLVIGFSGLSKLADIDAFAAALRDWRLLPADAVWPLTFAVPLAEVVVAGTWLLGVERHESRRMAVLMLVLYTVAYGIEVVAHGPVPCGCLGALAIWEEAERNAVAVVLRNVVLLAMLLGGAHLSNRGAAARSSDVVSVRQDHRPAFTLIELLITVAVVGVLIALTLPSLRRVRLRSHDAVKLATLRSHGGVFGAYSADWRDFYPYMTHPRATSTVLRCGQYAYPAPYFWVYNAWNLALAPGYYDEACLSRSFYAPGQTAYKVFTDYWYFATFLADPAFWHASTR